MTVPNNVPDWRTRIAPTNSRIPSPRSADPAPGFMSTDGVITSEMEAPWHTRAGGTRAVLLLSLVTLFVTLTASGQLAAVFATAAIDLMPLALMIVIMLVIANILPGGRFIAGAIVGAGARSVASARHRPRVDVPGRQLTIACSTGHTEEVLVASARRLPAGTRLHAIGPRIFGRRHAWVVRLAGGGLILSRGVVRTVFVSSLLLVLSALSLLEGVAR